MQARRSNRNVRERLFSKGVYYGSITARPDGSLDTSNVRGVDTDLRVRPFFAEGKTASIREFIVGALKDEMGLEAWDPILCAATDPQAPRTVTSNSGFEYDPQTDEYERPVVCDAAQDQDQDGIVAEVDPALVDHLEFYLLNYFKPGNSKISWMERNGLRHMENIGCTACHVRNLTIDSDRRIADVETRYDARRGVFNELYAVASGQFEVEDDGQRYPLLNPARESFEVKNIFTD